LTLQRYAEFSFYKNFSIERFVRKYKKLSEETHAKYAKPEGNRVQAYNNALTYAKKENTPFIYGYTNHTGKFFALEQPIKVKGEPIEAERLFKDQYKNCSVVYMTYPNKSFLKEDTKPFKEELFDWELDNVGFAGDSLTTSGDLISGDCTVYGHLEVLDGKSEETVDDARFKYNTKEESVKVVGLSSDFSDGEVSQIEDVLLDNLKTNL
jgi:hypothetical protein